METTFYEDPFHAPTTDMKSLKRPATLDLDSPANTKKQRMIPILTSPDVNMLKLASPELERFIMAQQGTITTTPTPTQYLFPRNVTEEQEEYARGFVDALAQLHQPTTLPNTSELLSNSIITTSVPSVSWSGRPVTSNASTFHPLTSINQLYGEMGLPVQVQAATSSTLSAQQATSSTASMTRPSSVDSSSSNSYPGCLGISVPNVTIKEEPQTVPSDCSGITPPLSPIDMEDQERIKLERKRYRNRIAASKCRRRKLERIAKLEDKVKELKNENTELGAAAKKLREQVCHLKQEVLNHVKSGCQLLIAQHF